MISKEEVKKIATLARIKLSEDEEKSLQKDLSSILDYVGTLNEVDTLAVKPQSHAIDILNIVREDEIIEKDSAQEETAALIVKSAPDHDNGYIKVKAIL